MISIIIPVYNTEKYLQQCLDTVCAQTFRDLEIIAVNDGSPDNAKAILADYQKRDGRIQVIEKENGGLSSARNAGLKIAKGEYILFLDSDDWMDTDACELAVAAAESEHADIVMWSYYREFGTSSKITYLWGTEPLVFHAGDPDFPYRQIVGPLGKELRLPQQIDRLSTAWGKLYRREIIEDNLFVDTKIIGTEDCLFNVQVFSNAGTVAYLPKAMNHYRKDNDSSLTFHYDATLADRWKENYRRISAFLVQNGAPAPFSQALSHRICCGLIGLGIRLSSDSALSGREKTKEMKRILNMEHYHRALTGMDTSDLPIYWRPFFYNARHQNAETLLFIIRLMTRVHKLITKD